MECLRIAGVEYSGGDFEKRVLTAKIKYGGTILMKMEEKDLEELGDQSFMPKIEIKELSMDEVKLPEGWETFGPVACMNCHNTEGLTTRYFELNVPAENMLVEQEIKRMMKETFGVKNYGHIGGGEREILTSSECPKCKSNDIFEDF